MSCVRSASVVLPCCIALALTATAKRVTFSFMGASPAAMSTAANAFQRTMDLDQFVEAGVEIDSKFTPELVFTIFNPKTSLHDGSIILR